MAEIQPAGQFYDVFISYGRADSREFATSLYQHFVDQGYRIWFDANDIPLGVDFQNQIDDGIIRAHSFLFLISPHSVNSDYCLREIKQALRFNKRIIPVLHVEEIDQVTWQQRNPGKTDADWEQAKAAGRHSCYANMHPDIGKINWAYCRENQDDIEAGLAGIKNIIERHPDYVFQHTYFLSKALEWQRLQRQSQYLLIQSERQQAEAWLKVRFAPEQPPCSPTDLHCEFITESVQNANNLRSQTFLAHADEDRIKTEQVRRSLLREGITVWTSRADIKTGSTFQQEINRGIEQTDNLIYLISPNAINSKYCQQEVDYALSLNKRVIPLLIEPTPLKRVPKSHRALQFINFTEDDGSAQSKLLNILKADASYHNQHTRLLVKAIKWQQQQANDSLLLRGYNLRNAEAWLRTAQPRRQYGPTKLQSDFVQASLQRPVDESLDVFVSYSRADSDFTRNLNEALQTQGKTTWFDQENIDPGVDFQQEIYRGIATSDNFLFVISPSSISSPYCKDEVDYACRLNKRIITVLHRPVDPADLHPELAKVQWIDFNQYEGEFYPNFSQVIRAIEYDREHVRNHTKWSQRALEWEQRDRTEDLLLRGSELTLANTWFEAQQETVRLPAATSLLKTFITACIELRDRLEREREECRLKDLKRARRIAIGTTIAGMMMAGLSLWATHQSRQAKIGQIKNLLVAAQANFEAGKPSEALLSSLEGTMHLKRLRWPGKELQLQADASLRQMAHAVQESNRLTGYGTVDISFSPDGRYIALVGFNDTVELWDLNTHTVESLTISPSETSPQAEITLTSVDFSVDGQQLALGDNNGHVYLQDLNGERATTQFPAHSDEITQVRYSPNGQYLATTAYDDRTHLWTLQGQPIRQFDHHTDDIWSIAFGQNGQHIATASQDKTVHLIDLQGKAIMAPMQQEEAAVGVHISANNQSLATAAIPATVNLWQLNGNNKQPSEQWTVDEKGKGDIQTLLFSPNSQHLVTATRSGAIELWDLAGNLIDNFMGHPGSVYQIALSPDGKHLVSSGDDDTVRLWQLQPETFRHVQKPNDLGVIDISFSGAAGYLVTEDGPDLHLWNLAGQKAAELPNTGQKSIAAQVSADGETVATIHQLSDDPEDTQVDFWQIKGGKPTPLPLDLPDAQDIALSADGQYLAVSLGPDSTQLWTMEAAQPQRLFTQTGVAMDLSADGQTLANLTTDGVVELFDVQGDLKTSFEHPSALDLDGNPQIPNTIFLSADGQLVVTTTEEDIYLWDAAGSLVTTWSLADLPARGDYIQTAALSPDGKWLVAATETGAYLFSTAGDRLAHLPHPQEVTAVHFSPDSQHLITRSADADGTARVWRVESSQSLLDRSCAWVIPYLQTLDGQNGEDTVNRFKSCQNMPVK